MHFRWTYLNLFVLNLKAYQEGEKSIGLCHIQALNYTFTSFSNFCFQDVGGQDKIRPLWRHYYTGTQGLIFVVDCADRDRIDEARQELHRIINDREMRDAIILIFANKQDLPDGEWKKNLLFILERFAIIYYI